MAVLRTVDTFTPQRTLGPNALSPDPAEVFMPSDLETERLIDCAQGGTRDVPSRFFSSAKQKKMVSFKPVEHMVKLAPQEQERSVKKKILTSRSTFKLPYCCWQALNVFASASSLIRPWLP